MAGSGLLGCAHPLGAQNVSVAHREAARAAPLAPRLRHSWKPRGPARQQSARAPRAVAPAAGRGPRGRRRGPAAWRRATPLGALLLRVRRGAASPWARRCLALGSREGPAPALPSKSVTWPGHRPRHACFLLARARRWGRARTGPSLLLARAGAKDKCSKTDPCVLSPPPKHGEAWAGLCAITHTHFASCTSCTRWPPLSAHLTRPEARRGACH